MNFREIIQNTSAPFDEISVPSRGVFYKNKKDTFIVKYLTAKEENVLTSPTLTDSGKAMEMVMSSCLLDWDGDIENLLVGDKDAFLLYLRSTAYGDDVKFTYTCPNCKKESESSVALSGFEMKETDEVPNENGEFEFTLPSKMRLKKDEEPKDIVIKFRPKTLKDEINIIKSVEQEKKMVGGERIDNTIEITYRNQITSINDIDDENFIKNIIKRMTLSDSSAFRNYMEEVEPGVDNKIKSVCNNCQFSSTNVLPITTGFFGLTPEYKNNMMEEIFLISYYGKGGYTREDLFNMPVYERRWVLERIQEEVDKKNKAEKAAMQKAKRQSKSGF